MNFITSLLSLCGWILWGYIVLAVDPSVPLAPVAFYLALFAALTCTLARLLSGGKGHDAGESGSTPAPSLGHAAIVSVVLLFALWMQSLRMLTPLNGVLLAAMLLFIELGFFLGGSGGRRPRVRRQLSRPPAGEAGLASERRST